MKRRSFLSTMLACAAFGYTISAGAINTIIREARARVGTISFYPYFSNRRWRKDYVEEIALAKNRIAQYVIAIPEQCPAVVRFAAQELKEHLDAITEVDFQNVNIIPEDKNSIVLASQQ